MGGHPSPKILKLYNMATMCIERNWTPEQYWSASSKDTQAIITVMGAKESKRKWENDRHA